MRIELRIARSGGPAGRPGRPAQAERRVRPSARARRAEGRIDLFRLDVPANDSVLSALVRVYECLDSTLAFRYACGKIKCGECGVVVNGTPCLACRKLVEPLLVVESLPGLPLVRDLVVDRTAVLRDLLEHTSALAERAGGPDAAGCRPRRRDRPRHGAPTTSPSPPIAANACCASRRVPCGGDGLMRSPAPWDCCGWPRRGARRPRSRCYRCAPAAGVVSRCAPRTKGSYG